MLQEAEISEKHRLRAAEIIETATLNEASLEQLQELIAEGFQALENNFEGLITRYKWKTNEVIKEPICPNCFMNRNSKGISSEACYSKQVEVHGSLPHVQDGGERPPWE